MYFPPSLLSSPAFCAHLGAFWYILNELSARIECEEPDPEVLLQEDIEELLESYYEVYSDF